MSMHHRSIWRQITFLLVLLLLAAGRSASAADTVGVWMRYERALPGVSTQGNPTQPYDPAPPKGVAPGTGVSVDAEITTPEGVKFLWPCYWDGKNWKLAFYPKTPGEYKATVTVVDKAGRRSADSFTFTATPSDHRGALRVSRQDPRYFEFSNGEPLTNPIGIHINTPDLMGSLPEDTQFRVWAQGNGPNAYADLERAGQRRDWTSGAFTDDAPVPGDLSLRMTAKSRFAVMRARPGVAGRKYRWQAYVRTQNVTGPAGAVPQQPKGVGSNYGFGMWLNRNRAGTDLAVNTRWLNGTTGWQWVGGEFVLGGESGGFGELKMGLVNARGGQADIYQQSLREVKDDGTLGEEELLETPHFSTITRYSMYAAAHLENIVRTAEKNRQLVSLNLLEKESPGLGNLDHNGSREERDRVKWPSWGWYAQDNIYGPKNDTVTANRWYQRAIIRYAMARYGGSPAVHSLEYLNEANPDENSAHFWGTKHFVEYVHSFPYRNMLATTSAWTTRPKWLKTAGADFYTWHAYIPETGGNEALALDSALIPSFFGLLTTDAPLVMGEISIGKNTKLPDTVMKDGTRRGMREDAQMVWLHKWSWAATGPQAAYFWHWYLYNPTLVGQTVKPLAAFLKGEQLNNGRYTDIQAKVTGGARAFGQKDTAHGEFHLWVDNPNHTWMKPTGAPRLSGSVTVGGMPAGAYDIQLWDTRKGEVYRTYRAQSVGGEITVPYEGLEADFAVKADKAGRVTPVPKPEPVPPVVKPPVVDVPNDPDPVPVPPVVKPPTPTPQMLAPPARLFVSWRAGDRSRYTITPPKGARPTAYRLYVDGMRVAQTTALSGWFGPARRGQKVTVSAVYAAGESARVGEMAVR